ncbi:MAG: hypothetical protein CMO55_13020 [Verrucomicrobiales bacterium]|nr:hypothetical protein [Verrucomicrobiales bacterium]
MNLQTSLKSKHSKAQTILIAKEIGDSRERFEELLSFVLGEDMDLARRAAWVVACCAEEHPDMVQPYLDRLLGNLQRPDLHDGVKRNTMKVAAELALPDELSGLAADIAFRLLGSPDETVAVKVHSMSVLESLCIREPALAEELRLSIEHQLPTGTKAGFRSKARRVLASLERLGRNRGRDQRPDVRSQTRNS